MKQLLQFKLSVLAWKSVLAVLVFLSAQLFISELRYAYQPLQGGVHGTVGAELLDQAGLGPDGQNSNILQISALTADSELAVAGAKVGDLLQFEQPINRWRRFTPGEAVPIKLFQGSEVRTLTVAAHATAITKADYFDYISRMLLVIPALIFGLLIGFKGAHDKSYRTLALTFITLSFSAYFNFNYSPNSLVFQISKAANLLSYGLIWYSAAAFAMKYQSYEPTPTRQWLSRLFPWYRAVVVAMVLYSVPYYLGYQTPQLWLLGFVSVLVSLVIIVTSLIDGWRQSRGQLKQRHSWLLSSILVNAVPSFLTWVPAFDWSVQGILVTVMLSFIGQFLMYIGLAYSVLRHDIFNFNFAISRALIFSTVSLLLLCAFGFIKWLIEPLLHGSGEHETGFQQQLVDGLIAVGMYLIFHKIHGHVEDFLERLFFQSWHENEVRLRKFVQDAAHIISPDALLSALMTALERFAGGAGVAIYLPKDNASYELAVGNGLQAPALLDADDGLIVRLRSEMCAQQDPAVHSALQCEIALPMCHRGGLNGFVVLGGKSDGSTYRPDEVALLTFAVNQVGLDLLAARVLQNSKGVRVT